MQKKDYWVLMENQTILGVFETLEDCFVWAEEKKAGTSLVIQRVRRLECGQFKIQEIFLRPNEKFE